jgi:hypothetical protein
VTVVLAGAGRRIALFALLEERPEPPPIDPVTTDASGRFAFRGLDAGPYLLDVRKTGYAAESPATDREAPQKPIELRIGEELRGLNIRLARSGSR